MCEDAAGMLSFALGRETRLSQNGDVTGAFFSDHTLAPSLAAREMLAGRKKINGWQVYPMVTITWGHVAN